MCFQVHQANPSTPFRPFQVALTRRFTTPPYETLALNRDTPPLALTWGWEWSSRQHSTPLDTRDGVSMEDKDWVSKIILKGIESEWVSEWVSECEREWVPRCVCVCARDRAQGRTDSTHSSPQPSKDLLPPPLPPPSLHYHLSSFFCVTL